MAHTLIIKGTPAEVQAALIERGVGWFDITPHPHFPECVVLSNADTEWAMLARWFCEDRAWTKGEGFSPGTLLWYGPRFERTN